MGYDGVRMYPCLARDTTRTPTSWSNLETAFSGHVELPNLINFRHFSLGIFISSCADSWQFRAFSIMFDQDTTNIHGAGPYRPYSEFHHCWWLFFQLFSWIPVSSRCVTQVCLAALRQPKPPWLPMMSGEWMKLTGSELSAMMGLGSEMGIKHQSHRGLPRGAGTACGIPCFMVVTWGCIPIVQWPITHLLLGYIHI